MTTTTLVRPIDGSSAAPVSEGEHRTDAAITDRGWNRYSLANTVVTVSAAELVRTCAVGVRRAQLNRTCRAAGFAFRRVRHPARRLLAADATGTAVRSRTREGISPANGIGRYARARREAADLGLRVTGLSVAFDLIG